MRIACAFLWTMLLGVSAGAEDRRNPFDLPDVQDPTGADVKEFAKNATPAGGKDDKNAEQWVENETTGKKGSLDGEWSGRWSAGKGTAKIQVKKDRVFILYSDANGKWMMEAVRDGDKLSGRWVNVANACDTGHWAGKIVDDERIDGAWTDDERWDFRRKLKK